MTAKQIRELQETLVVAFARSACVRWDRLRLHYENVDVDSGKYVGKFENYIVQVLLDGKAQDDFALSRDALEALREIKKTFADDGRQVWKWLVLTVERNGDYNFTYKYDMPPLTAEMLSDGLTPEAERLRRKWDAKEWEEEERRGKA
jgi:hypothetical protein